MTGARRKKHCKVVPSKGCDSTWFRDLQTDYFKSVVALANEVIDFASHTVLLFDKTRDVFARRWHYLYGLSPLTGSKSQIPTTAAMRKILHSGSAVVSVPTGGKRTPSRPVQLIAPLVLLGRPSGLLIMEAPAGSTFSVYDAYLADSVVAVAASGVDQDYDSNLLRFVEFCILHRRRFFSAFPSLDEELQGCLERILGEGDLASLAKKGMLHGNVRTPQLSASESSRLTLKYAAFYPPLSKAAEERARYYDPRIGRFISRDPMLSLDYYAVRGMDLQKLRGWQKIVTPRWLNPYVYCLNNPVNLVDPTGGCGTEVPDEITEETLKKVVELAKEYGVKDLEGIYNACENWRSWCSDDLADCQACATLECLYKLPSTLGSYKKCLEKEYPKCASMSAFRKEKKKLE